MNMKEWKYLGDVNPEYGGYWYKADQYGNVDIVEIIDATNMVNDMSQPVIVQSGSIYLDVRSRSFKSELRDALECCGLTIQDLRKRGKESIIDIMIDVWHSYYGVYPDRCSLVRLDLSYNLDSSLSDMYDREAEIELHIDYHSDITEWVENCWLN